jgi:methylphosphotriester-DNA--protein-cysteine methyltransferase
MCNLMSKLSRESVTRRETIEALCAMAYPPAQSQPLVVAAAGLLTRHHATVELVAREIGMSPRQLRRHFEAEVGLAPKTFQRVMRFQRFFRRIASRPTESLAESAILSGYSDQSHLCRDCYSIAETSPARIVAAQRAYAAIESDDQEKDASIA